MTRAEVLAEEMANRVVEDATSGTFTWDQATIDGARTSSIPGTGVPTPEYPDTYGDCVPGYGAVGPDGRLVQGGHFIHAPAGGQVVCDWDPRCGQADPCGMWQPYGPRVLGTNSAFDAPHPAMGQPMCTYMHNDQPTQVAIQSSASYGSAAGMPPRYDAAQAMQQRGCEAQFGAAGLHQLGTAQNIVFHPDSTPVWTTARPCAR